MSPKRSLMVGSYHHEPQFTRNQENCLPPLKRLYIAIAYSKSYYECFTEGTFHQLQISSYYLQFRDASRAFWRLPESFKSFKESSVPAVFSISDCVRGKTTALSPRVSSDHTVVR